jgi:hypothetical protein
MPDTLLLGCLRLLLLGGEAPLRREHQTGKQHGGKDAHRDSHPSVGPKV